MDIIRFSIRNGEGRGGVILTVLFGMIALSIPILTPDVDRPVITVRTTWPGRSRKRSRSRS